MLKLIRILLSPLTLLYSFVIKARNRLFDKKIFKQTKVDIKIISVGNISVGGSGKTPLVIMLAKYLKRKNIKVGILSRGYGRKSKGYKLVSKGDKPLLNVQDAGDESYLIAEECRVPIAVAEKRVEGVQQFKKDVQLEIIILDDAFQHRWIKRDLDIVVIDQKFLSDVNSIDQRLLPLGLLREHFDSLERADIVIINKKFSRKIGIPLKFRKYLLPNKIFYSSYIIDGIYDLKSDKKFSIKDFEGQKSLVVCGIARPFSFLRILDQNNIQIKNKLVFVDHKNYTKKEVEKIRKEFYETNSYSVLTTQKDAVKLSEFARELDDIDIYYLKIDVKMDEGEEFYNVIDKLILNNN